MTTQNVRKKSLQALHFNEQIRSNISRVISKSVRRKLFFLAKCTLRLFMLSVSFNFSSVEILPAQLYPPPPPPLKKRGGGVL